MNRAIPAAIATTIAMVEMPSVTVTRNEGVRGSNPRVGLRLGLAENRSGGWPGPVPGHPLVTGSGPLKQTPTAGEGRPGLAGSRAFPRSPGAVILETKPASA